MISYHVFFSPKDGMPEDQVLGATRAFFAALEENKQIRTYRILRVTNPASFAGLPRFQAIVDFATQDEMDTAFAFMRQPGKIHSGAHGKLIEMVTDFRVSFSEDV